MYSIYVYIEMYTLALFNATVYSCIYFSLSSLIQLSVCRFAVQLILLNFRVDDLEIITKDNNYNIYIIFAYCRRHLKYGKSVNNVGVRMYGVVC